MLAHHKRGLRPGALARLNHQRHRHVDRIRDWMRHAARVPKACHGQLVRRQLDCARQRAEQSAACVEHRLAQVAQTIVELRRDDQRPVAARRRRGEGGRLRHHLDIESPKVIGDGVAHRAALAH
ncbi:MAG TPA: hypothetical protein VFE62_09115 [Gemmataceae bacterium]|nr:hypothetical protein [Gemmataceae bacterium]